MNSWFYIGARRAFLVTNELAITFSAIRLRGGKMGWIRNIVYACLTAFVAVVALAQDFPEHPANRKEAEAQGLARIGIDELKAPDGVHYFDYDVKTGFYAAAWRAAPKQ